MHLECSFLAYLVKKWRDQACNAFLPLSLSLGHPSLSLSVSLSLSLLFFPYCSSSAMEERKEPISFFKRYTFGKFLVSSPKFVEVTYIWSLYFLPFHLSFSPLFSNLTIFSFPTLKISPISNLLYFPLLTFLN